MPRVDLFHIGPQKSGTSWIYRCLDEHPGVAASPRDAVQYFDMHYNRGERWYLEHWTPRPGQILYDPTPSYLRSPWAPRRIAAHNADARIVVCLRDPIDRAFSHYWHERKKGRQRYRFEEVLSNYDLFASWVEPGLYAEHLERFLDHFPRGQLLVQRFEDLRDDPTGLLGELLRFAGVEASFQPSVLHRPINVAGPQHTPLHLGLHSLQRAMDLAGLKRGAGMLRQSAALSGRGAYLRGIDGEVRAELQAICDPEITRLENLLQIDLSHWRRPVETARAG